MSIKTEKPLLFWFVFLSLLSGALIVQSAFLPNEENYSLIPYLTWPPIVFFFLHYNSLSSLGLMLFMSVLSSIFFSLSVPVLFILYLVCFLSVFLIKSFVLSQSSRLFLTLVFIISFCFPYLVDLAYDFSINDFSLSTSLFYCSRAFATLVLSFFLVPLLNKQLQNKD